MIEATDSDQIGEIGDLICASMSAGLASDDLRSHDAVVQGYLKGEDEVARRMRGFALDKLEIQHPRLTLLPFLAAGGLSLRCANEALRLMEDCKISKRPKSQLGGALTRTEAMTALGINSHHVLSRLCTARLISRKSLQPDERGRVLKAGLIDSLLRRLWVPASSPRTKPPAVNDFLEITIDSALRNPGNNKGYSMVAGLTSLRIQEERVVEVVLPSQTLTLPQTAKAIGVHGEIVRGLIQRNYLRATKGTPKRPTVVFAESIEQFRATYVFASELARWVNSEPRRFAERLYAYGVRPVGGPGIDGMKVHMFQRSDLEGVPLAKVASMRGSKIPYSQTILRLNSESGKGLAVPLDQAAAHLGVSRSDVSTLIRNGFLERAIVPGILVMVEGESFRAYATKFLDPKKMPISDAAATCGMSIHQFSARWVASKRIVTEDLGVRVLVPRMNYRIAEYFYQAKGSRQIETT
jgi:hypothetical protein